MIKYGNKRLSITAASSNISNSNDFVLIARPQQQRVDKQHRHMYKVSDTILNKHSKKAPIESTNTILSQKNKLAPPHASPRCRPAEGAGCFRALTALDPPLPPLSLGCLPLSPRLLYHEGADITTGAQHRRKHIDIYRTCQVQTSPPERAH